MSLAAFAVNFVIALFALIDPIGNVPLFAAATVGAAPASRRLTAVYLALFAFVFMCLFFLTGLAVLRFFGISMPAFRIAGGILLLLMGLDMTRGELIKSSAAAGPADDAISIRRDAARRFEGLIAPFGVPLLVGPGAISTAVIYAEESRAFGASGLAVGVAVIFAVCLSVVAAFWLTGVISRLLGKVGMVIVVRILGLILVAMAVQFVLTGLAASTVGLVRKETAAPYQGRQHSDLGLERGARGRIAEVIERQLHIVPLAARG